MFSCRMTVVRATIRNAICHSAGGTEKAFDGYRTAKSANTSRGGPRRKRRGRLGVGRCRSRPEGRHWSWGRGRETFAGELVHQLSQLRTVQHVEQDDDDDVVVVVWKNEQTFRYSQAEFFFRSHSRENCEIPAKQPLFIAAVLHCSFYLLLSFSPLKSLFGLIMI